MQLLKPEWINHDGGKAIFSVDLHPDGSRLATGGQGQDSSGRVVVWNLKPVVHEKYEEDEKVPKLLCQLDQHLGCVNSVRWSCSGRYLASAGDDKVIIIWQQSSYGGGAVFGSNVVNVEAWRSVATLRGHNGDILDVAWSPGDLWLASASIDNCVIVWNTAKWPEQVRVLRGHTGLVKGVTWDPVGRYLTSQADDKSLRIWRTTDWATEEKIVDPFTECGGTTTVLRPSWSPDGQYLVSAHAMNNGGPTAQIIDRDGWNTDKDFVGHRKPITCVRFNPNILKKIDTKTGKSVQYCCVAIGSRDRSISIWFTSLKRPLVVVHDIFDDSVLDLSWSSCGRYLMAVSKDGTLAFINFSPEEIGFPLSQDETNTLHMKLYGKSAQTSASSVNPTIIENPELLRLREEERAQAKAASASEQSQKPAPPTPQRAPINKQIETRTADGKRRITPMFIPPTEGVENPNKSYEASFSSSQQEKSKIVVEKVDGVVEPNVSVSRPPSIFNANSSSSPGKGMCLPAEFNGVPAGLPARFSKSSGINSEKQVDNQITPVSNKRKQEDVQPIAIKRKRGRPPLYDRSSTPAATRASSPAAPCPAPVSSRTPVAATQHHVDLAPSLVLPEASLSKSARVQIPGEVSLDIPPPLLVVENDYRIGSRVGVGTPNLHRVSRTQLNVVSWVVYLTSHVTAASATSTTAAFTCHDKTLHILDIMTGEMILPPLQLQGRASQLFVQESSIMVLTTDATLTIWDLKGKKRILSESVRHLVEGRNGGVKCVQLTAEGTPVVLLTSGEAFTRCQDLEAWLLLGDVASVRSVVQPEYTMLPPCHPAENCSRPLASLLHQTAAYGSSRVSHPVISDEARQNITEVFINRMMTSAQYLRSANDYKFWLKRKIQFFIKEGLEKKLRDIFDDLLGPRHSGSANNQETPSWKPKLMIFDKKALLEEFLREILLAKNSLQLQRLYSEYKEQLDTNIIDLI
ncbi:protein HIRA isoform X2 [Procambarus clarkii]|uniref:protein HIRA isoform X2 n=1 Tax=Procambarus clarkii TaxID=6728 RepID=UPI001E6701FF|nr:protein HIRA-like isoform X2 [Procambarus clarkii]